MATKTARSTRPKLYLAGKVSFGCWRHGVVKGLRAAYGPSAERGPWKLLPAAVVVNGTAYDYAGPFFVSCDHGCAHKAGHGWPRDDGCIVAHETNPYTAKLCLEAVASADILFAWIDSEDAFGTIAEVGMAAHAGKRVLVAGPRRYPDLWFVYALATETLFRTNLQPAAALALMLPNAAERN